MKDYKSLDEISLDLENYEFLENVLKEKKEKIRKVIEILNYYDKYEEVTDNDFINKDIIINLCTMKNKIYEILND